MIFHKFLFYYIPHGTSSAYSLLLPLHRMQSPKSLKRPFWRTFFSLDLMRNSEKNIFRPVQFLRMWSRNVFTNRFVVVVGRCVTMSTHSRQAEAVQQNWHNKDEDGQREEELFS